MIEAIPLAGVATNTAASSGAVGPVVVAQASFEKSDTFVSRVALTLKQYSVFSFKP